MRGFLGGVSTGALLAAGGLMMLSLSVPLPERLTAGKPAAGPAGTGAEAVVAEPPAADTADAAETGIAEEAAGVAEAPAPDTGTAPQLPAGSVQVPLAPAGSQPRDADLAEAWPAGPDAAAAADDLSGLADADTAPAQRPWSPRTPPGRSLLLRQRPPLPGCKARPPASSRSCSCRRHRLPQDRKPRWRPPPSRRPRRKAAAQHKTAHRLQRIRPQPRPEGADLAPAGQPGLGGEETARTGTEAAGASPLWPSGRAGA